MFHSHIMQFISEKNSRTSPLFSQQIINFHCIWIGMQPAADAKNGIKLSS